MKIQYKLSFLRRWRKDGMATNNNFIIFAFNELGLDALIFFNQNM